MKINTISVKQNDNIFYIGKMKALDLVRIATTKIRKPRTSSDYHAFLNEVDSIVSTEIKAGDVWYLKKMDLENENVQRQQSLERLKNIGKDIMKINNIFPNAIICNISPLDDNKDLGEIIKISENTIEFDENLVEFSIIDGQHRLGGFNYTNNIDEYLRKYEMVVSILIGLKPAQQAELFATINGKQKPVSKSVLYDLSSMTEEEYTEQVMAHLITTWLNVTETSPLYSKIKMLGNGEGTISQAAMIEAIQPLFSDKKYKIDFDKPVLRDLFLKKDTKKIVQLLFDYLKCFISFFEKQDYNDEKHEIYIKSTGVCGLLKAFPTIYLRVYDDTIDRNENVKKLYDLINKKMKGFVPLSRVYPGGGGTVQKQFAQDVIDFLFSE